MKNLLFTLLGCLWAISAFGQASLEVTVVNNRNGKAISQLSLTFSNESIGYKETKTTNQQGKVFFRGLSTAGSYVVSVNGNAEFYPFDAEDLTFRANNSKSITIALVPKTTQQLDEVTISAGNSVAKINTVDAEVSSELETQNIKNLPIEGRDFTNALFRLPNVTKSTGFFPEAPNVSINGANSLYTSYLIDGMDNNEHFLGGPRFRVPVGFTKNITVLANNYSAEYGQSSNGVINVTSRSGSNNFTGDVYYEVRPGPVIDASSPFNQTDLSGNQVKDGFQRHQFGFSLGGPIQKDKTFFYLNAEQTISVKDNLLSVPQLNVNSVVRGYNDYTLLSARVDHNWTGHFRSTLRVNKGWVKIERQGGGLSGGNTFPEAATQQNRNSLAVALNNTYIGRNFTLETNYQYANFMWPYAQPETQNAPSVSVQAPNGETIAVLGGASYHFNIKEYTHQLQQKVTFYAGNHTIKAGIGFLGSLHSDVRGGNGLGVYTVQLNQQQLVNVASQNYGKSLSYRDIPSDVQVLADQIELHPGKFHGTQSIYSAYLEDLFSVSSRLNITLGLRYDYDNLSKAGAKHGDFNNIAPRFNANYKLSDRSSIRAGYGLFYDRIPYTIYSDAIAGSSIAPDYKEELRLLKQAGQLPENTDIKRITYDGNAAAFRSDVNYLQGPRGKELNRKSGYAFSNQKTILNPNGLDNPYAHQFSVGYQLQVRNDMLFYIDLIHKRGYNQFRLVDVNAPSPYQITDPNAGSEAVRSMPEADATRDVAIRYDAQGNPYALSGSDTLRNMARRVTMTQTGGESRYYAANVNFIKNRGSDRYSYRVSYTLSSLRNNTEDINFEAEDANNFENEWGPSINDRRHVISAFGTYYPLENLGVTLASLVQSGQPVNRIADATNFGGTTDLNGDGTSRAVQYTGKTDRAPGASRNDKRLPWSYTFDLSVQYEVAIFGENNGQLQLRADVFNLLNTTNYSGYTSNATASNQVQIGLINRDEFVYRNAAPPRQFQFSVQYSF